MRPRILLADDHVLLLEAFKRLLEPEFEVVAAVTNGRTLLRAALEHKPEIIVADIGMPELNGIEAGRQIRKALPAVRIVYLTMHADPALAAQAFRYGASGYLLKSSAAAELTKAIHSVAAGRTYLTPLVANGDLNALLNETETRTGLAALSSREREVLQLLAEGRSMKQIAGSLNITPRTVAFHKYRIMAALRLKTTADLVQFAIKNGIVVT